MIIVVALNYLVCLVYCGKLAFIWHTALTVPGFYAFPFESMIADIMGILFPGLLAGVAGYYLSRNRNITVNCAKILSLIAVLNLLKVLYYAVFQPEIVSMPVALLEPSVFLALGILNFVYVAMTRKTPISPA